MLLQSIDIKAAEKELCSRSLAEFAKRAWHILEPATELKWGWALDAICLHLEQVHYGNITRLLMNVPPGSMKSLLTGVIFPAWEWGPRGRPDLRFLGTAHKQDLAIRDATKCRRLIQSQWYQERWPTKLTSDQNAKTKFENDSTGFREAMAFTGMTGSRGDRILLDDPLSADDANSVAERYKAEISFTEALPTRINNDKSAIIVIMQRLHDQDTSGLILSRGLPYVHLCLPMRYEADRHCTTPFFTDPRSVGGELLFPDRFPEEQVDDLEKTMGMYAVAGQLQQRPVPRAGGLFNRSDFKFANAAPANIQWVRGWDIASSTDANSAHTAGVRMGVTPQGEFYIDDVERFQGSPFTVESKIVATANYDGRMIRGSIPQDPGAGGKFQAHYLIRALRGFRYFSSLESKDKVTRAEPFAAQVEAGNVYLVENKSKPWVKDYLDELALFPMGKLADQVDASSRAFQELTTRRQTTLRGRQG